MARSFEPDEILWFVLENGRYVAISPDQDGLYHSGFPGLWLDAAALLAGERAAIRAAVELGVSTPEHAAFVATLAAVREKPAT